MKPNAVPKTAPESQNPALLLFKLSDALAGFDPARRLDEDIRTCLALRSTTPS